MGAATTSRSKKSGAAYELPVFFRNPNSLKLDLLEGSAREVLRVLLCHDSYHLERRFNHRAGNRVLKHEAGCYQPRARASSLAELEWRCVCIVTTAVVRPTSRRRRRCSRRRPSSRRISGDGPARESNPGCTRVCVVVVVCGGAVVVGVVGSSSSGGVVCRRVARRAAGRVRGRARATGTSCATARAPARARRERGARPPCHLSS